MGSVHALHTGDLGSIPSITWFPYPSPSALHPLGATPEHRAKSRPVDVYTLPPTPAFPKLWKI